MSDTNHQRGRQTRSNRSQISQGQARQIERKTKTEWHKVVIYNEGLVGVAERFLQKGSTVYIEGQLQTRSYDKDGETRYVTEIVLQKYKGELTMLGKKDSPDGGYHAPIAPSMRKIETDDDFDF